MTPYQPTVPCRPLPELLGEIRCDARLSQAQFGARVELSEYAVAQIERGETPISQDALNLYGQLARRAK